jgi:hypothetical protein
MIALKSFGKEAGRYAAVCRASRFIIMRIVHAWNRSHFLNGKISLAKETGFIFNSLT